VAAELAHNLDKAATRMASWRASSEEDILRCSSSVLVLVSAAQWMTGGPRHPFWETVKISVDEHVVAVAEVRVLIR
jgi:hypothetical protein